MHLPFNQKRTQCIMNAIRQIHEVTSGTVTITLPHEFTAKQVEVIVLPVEEALP